MAFVVKDRVKVTTTTTGTGTLTLGAAAGISFQDFSVIGDGNTTSYTIVDPSVGSFEVGIGTYSAAGDTLSRDTVLSSSNADALVDFVSGLKEVFVAYPAERAVVTSATPTNGDILVFSSGLFAPQAGVPQVTVYSSGSGTYTVPTGCRFLEIEMVGAGGGGGSSGTAGTGNNGANAGATTINSTLIVANGGVGGASSTGSNSKIGGAGGTATGTANILVPGQRGTANGVYNTTSGVFTGGGVGGACAFGKSGGDGGDVGGTAVVNGAGGGGGGYAQTIITSPAASYTYAVAAGGAGGGAGTSGFAGEAGRAGLIIFRAYF